MDRFFDAKSQLPNAFSPAQRRRKSSRRPRLRAWRRRARPGRREKSGDRKSSRALALAEVKTAGEVWGGRKIGFTMIHYGSLDVTLHDFTSTRLLLFAICCLFQLGGWSGWRDALVGSTGGKSRGVEGGNPYSYPEDARCCFHVSKCVYWPRCRVFCFMNVLYIFMYSCSPIWHGASFDYRWASTNILQNCLLSNVQVKPEIFGVK